MLRNWFYLFISTVAALSLASTCPAADELQQKLQFAAQEWITTKFATEKIFSISVGSFRCVGEHQDKANQASGGMEITRRLNEAFEENKFKVENNAPVKIHGEYLLVKKDGEFRLSISFTLTDTNTFKEVIKFKLEPLEIKRPDIIAKLTGLTGEIGGTTIQLRTASLNKIVNSPKPPDGNAGSIVKPAANSEYGVEILVKNPETTEFRPRATRIQGGMPFIQLNRNDVYIVRLYNNSANPAAAELLLDGLGTLALNDDERLRNGRYIIPAGETVEIKGWSINNEAEGAHEFKIGGFDQSIAAKKLPHERVKIGLISATFARAWDAANPPPDVQKRILIKDNTPNVANVLGNRITQQLQEVNYDYAFPTGVVSIRYSDESPSDLPSK